MLSAEENARLTQVGAGTPMGELLRRYWWPIAAVAELEDRTTKAVRLLGEDLVLYRDRGDTFGLVDRYCPHRRMSMMYGLVEDCGIRCVYHGWKFDETGRCLEQPFEQTAHPESKFVDKVRIKAYPVEQKAGLLWAYLGPAPAPCLWDWELYSHRGFKQIVFSELSCNWVQCQENAIDPVHFEWLHLNWASGLRDRPRAPRHVKIGFDEFEWGFIYRRVYEHKTESDDDWTVGRVCLWPNCLYVGSFEWSVPVDDEHTLRIRWSVDSLPGDEPYEQEKIPFWYSDAVDPREPPWRGRQSTHQDLVAFVGQGTVADRTQEHLGESDRGVIMMRKRFFADMDRVARGEDPKAVLRDPTRNHRIALPKSVTDQTALSKRMPVPSLSGQPQEIADELRRVWLKYSK